MKRVGKIIAAVLLLLVVAALGFFGWAKVTTAATLEQTFTAHVVDFPVPFPLSETELEALRQARRAELEAAAQPLVDADGSPVDLLAGVDVDALALERARERGEHLVNARYVCAECHGRDFSGGVMIDDPAIGRLLGPNLTAGAGSRTTGYTAPDWDRIVRHGIRPDGRAAAMPSEDFVRMSDRELSDIVAYLEGRPAVDNEVPRPTLGPLGTILMATGKLKLSASIIADHSAAHALEPPVTEPSAEFGRHLAAVCTGCHRAELVGGPIAAGPPDWLPAANLTPHTEGLSGWDYGHFEALMRRGVRPDGSQVRAPMSQMTPYGQAMTDVEVQALWAYLQSLEARPTGR